MGTARGIIKYGLYFFIAVWMFALGVMVGRGTSPVTFDTESFQERLETIAREFGERETPDEKPDLKFYDALNSPVRHEVSGRKEGAGEIVPKKEVFSPESILNQDTPGGVPVKTSKKSATLNRDAVAIVKKKDSPGAAPAVIPPKTKKAVPKVLKQKEVPAARNSDEKAGTPASTQGRYTIQVAAYKAFSDAVTQMAVLEKKGFKAYRVKGSKDGTVWYRVRTGAFKDYKSAAAQLEKLKKAKIAGMIIKKDK
ncbi:MAG: SPOR domain-containing protein [Desulfobacterales bacterium]|nr:SPOR domain-containing protein [Desulfobacterales bacterium]